MTIREKLFTFEDPKYRDFQSKLVPNIEKETIIGVRTPDMKKIAKEFAKEESTKDFLKDVPHKYYEENLVHIFILSMIKDFDECVKGLEAFFPYIDCWPVCDQSSPGIFKKNHEKVLPLVKKWIDSDHVYTSRYGTRILMNEFLGDDFKPEYLSWVASKKGDDYYLKMMVAWYFATALAKQYDESVKVIERKELDPWTHNKAIQKACESFRVSDEHKEYLKTLKIK